MRLRKLQQELGVPVRLHHRAFVLRGEPGLHRFTDYHLRHRRAARELTGMPFDLPEVGSHYPSSSLPALQAAEWVKRHAPDQFDAFDSSLFEAFFHDTRDISDPDVLGELAARAGIDAEALTAALRSEEGLDQVWADYRDALEQGVQSIPTVLIGDEAISGAVPYEEYRRAAQRVIGT